MRQKKFFFLHLLTILIAVTLLIGVSVLTASADPGDGGEAIADDGGNQGGAEPGDSGNISDPGEVPADNGGDQNIADNGGNAYDTPEAAAPGFVQDQYDQYRNDYIDGYDDLGGYEPQYTPNENLDDLPEVSETEVVAATAEPLPDVEVSDATLFSGIVMWLCVAVGISVVAGVMVSKRTHRRGA